MALLQGIKKLFGPLLDDLDCISAVKEAMELQVEAFMWCPASKEIKKLFGPLLDDLDFVSAVKDKQTSRNDSLANFLKSLIYPFIKLLWG